jgi:hypothetical protein
MALNDNRETPPHPHRLEWRRRRRTREITVRITRAFRGGPDGLRTVRGCESETSPRPKVTAPSPGVRYISCEVGDRPLSVGRGAAKLRSRPRSRAAGRCRFFDNLLCRRRAGTKGTGCSPLDIRARSCRECGSPRIAGGPDASLPASVPCLQSGTARRGWRGSSDVLHQCEDGDRGMRGVVANVRSQPRMFSPDVLEAVGSPEVLRQMFALGL